MAKLRKMLGKLTDPEVIALMRQIETQSTATLAKFAAGAVEADCLPIVVSHAEDAAAQMAQIIRLAKDGAQSGRKTPEKALKLAIAEARKRAAAEKDETAQAAMRAISTACAVMNTPTNALGFAFYAAAAHAYETAGLMESAEVYDALARKKIGALLTLLEEMSVPNEANPAKIDWGC